MRTPSLAALALLTLLFDVERARAVRPFVTDDARTVGEGLAQLETWMQLDSSALEHNVFAAIGPVEWLELSIGATHGGVHSGDEAGYSLAGPVVQAKALPIALQAGGWPGLAVAAGVLAPFGDGPFTAAGWGGYGYIAVTESLVEEGLLLHVNLGAAFADDGDVFPGAELTTSVTAGLAAQVRIVGGLHGLGEIYYGDPFDPHFNAAATQVGLRYVFNANCQIDGTLGTTLSEVESAEGNAQTEQWGTLGIRLVSPALW